MIDPANTLLFQGDSITDCGRNREDSGSNSSNALGRGYPSMIASRLLLDRPGDDLKIFNRGISGNRIVDMYARWKADGVNMQPDIISILIGVNDTWHEFSCQNGVEIDRYEVMYRLLLDYTLEKCSEVKLVLCEPFTLPCGVITAEFAADVDLRRAAVKKLAEEYGAVFVPFQSVFNQALDEAPAEYWSGDGVHPTLAGHALMTNAWLKAVS